MNVKVYRYHYKLHQSETVDSPGITIRIPWVKWLHYFSLNWEKQP